MNTLQDLIEQYPNYIWTVMFIEDENFWIVQAKLPNRQQHLAHDPSLNDAAVEVANKILESGEV